MWMIMFLVIFKKNILASELALTAKENINSKESVEKRGMCFKPLIGYYKDRCDYIEQEMKKYEAKIVRMTEVPRRLDNETRLKKDQEFLEGLIEGLKHMAGIRFNVEKEFKELGESYSKGSQESKYFEEYKREQKRLDSLLVFLDKKYRKLSLFFKKERAKLKVLNSGRR